MQPGFLSARLAVSQAANLSAKQLVSQAEASRQLARQLGGEVAKAAKAAKTAKAAKAMQGSQGNARQACQLVGGRLHTG